VQQQWWCCALQGYKAAQRAAAAGVVVVVSDDHATRAVGTLSDCDCDCSSSGVLVIVGIWGNQAGVIPYTQLLCCCDVTAVILVIVGDGRHEGGPITCGAGGMFTSYAQLVCSVQAYCAVDQRGTVKVAMCV
jgi:hypothetical protein